MLSNLVVQVSAALACWDDASGVAAVADQLAGADGGAGLDEALLEMGTVDVSASRAVGPKDDEVAVAAVGAAARAQGG